MALNLDLCIEELYKGEILNEMTVKELCERLKETFLYQSNIQTVELPVTIVGNIHGQFYDLLELFRVGGRPPQTNYLFLGGYVDRGYFSVESMSLLVCLQLRYPTRIHLLRGSHESRLVTQVYGFYAECIRKYGNSNVWRYFTDMFDHLPLAAVVDRRVFCVHSGMSPSITSLDHIRVLNRFKEIPAEGSLTDLMWSDPDASLTGFKQNTKGAGHLFGSDIVDKFLRTNSLEQVVRSHQLCLDGFQILFGGKLSTIWSAPNFCYNCGNVACILELTDNQQKYYNTYLAAPDTERIFPPPDSLKEVPDYYL